MKKDNTQAQQIFQAKGASTNNSTISSNSLPAFLQIKNWVSQFTSKKVLRQQKNDILNVVGQLGSEGYQYLLECLLESIEFSGLSALAKNSLHTTGKGQFLTQYLHDLIFSPCQGNVLDFFSAALIHTICGPNNTLAVFNSAKIPSILPYFNDISKCLKLPIVHQLFLTLSLALSSNESLASEGIKSLKDKIVEYTGQINPQAMPPNMLPNALMQFIGLHNDFFEAIPNEIQALKICANDPKNKEIKPLVLPGDEESLDDVHKETTFPNIEDIGSIIKPSDILREIGAYATISIETLSRSLEIFTKWTDEDLYLCIEVLAQDSLTKSVNEDSIQRIASLVFNVESKGNQADWISFNNQEFLEKSTSAPAEWKIDVFSEFLASKVLPTNPDLSLTRALQYLDREVMQIRDDKTFKQFFNIIQQLSKVCPFSVSANIILKRWEYRSSQVQFLKCLLSVGNPDYIMWNDIPKRIANLDFNPAYRYASLNPICLQFYACLDILELLLELSESDEYTTVMSIFDYPISKCPDILLVSLSQLSPKYGSAALDSLYSTLLPNYLSNHVNSLNILEAIWKFRQDLLISAICEIYKKDTRKENTILNLSRVLDISQYIKDSLITLSNCNDYGFSVALGILAGKREFLHFDQWLNERVRTVGDPFVNALLAYVEDNLINPVLEIASRLPNASQAVLTQNAETILEKAQLTIEILTIIFESLLVEHYPDKLTGKNRHKLQELYQQVLRFFPQLSGPADSPAQAIEKKANYNFQRYYQKELTAEDVTVLLKQLMNSNSPEDREVFACMITSLIEESRFHEQYPLPELLLTGQLFGAIINAQLINTKPLGLMMEQIRDSTKKQPKRVQFAMKAVEAMKERLPDLPNFTAALFDPACLFYEQHPQFLYSIYNYLAEKKINIQIQPKQLELLKARAEQQRVEQMKQPTQIQAQQAASQQEANLRKQQLEKQQQQQVQQQQQQQNTGQSKSQSQQQSTQASQQQAQTQQPPQTSQQSQSSQLTNQQSPQSQEVSVTLNTTQTPSTTTQPTAPAVAATQSSSSQGKEDNSSSNVTKVITSSQPQETDEKQPSDGATRKGGLKNRLKNLKQIFDPSLIGNNNIPAGNPPSLAAQLSNNSGGLKVNSLNSGTGSLINSDNFRSADENSLQSQLTLQQQQQLQQPKQIILSQSGTPQLQQYPLSVTPTLPINSMNQLSLSSTPTLLAGQSSSNNNGLANGSSLQSAQQTSQQQQMSLQLQLQLQQQQAQQNQQGTQDDGTWEYPRAYSGGVGFTQRNIGLSTDYSKWTVQQILQNEDHSGSGVEETVRNKVNFALNNLNENNIDKHSNDMRLFAENEAFIQWLGVYLVVRRATHESEINILYYVALVEKIKSNSLFTIIIKESLLLMQKLLMSELPFSASDRQILKNLGFWIGVFTLSRGKSIPAKYLSIKALIVKSYPTRSDLVVQIVFNILRGAKDSKVFSPSTNRWVRRICSLLEEIKQITQKETIKVIVSQIFGTLQIDPSTLEQCNYLRYYIAELKKNDKISIQQSQTPQAQQGVQPQLLQTQQQQLFLQQQQTPPQKISDRVVISEELKALSKSIDIRQAVGYALDTAINEIINPVISRSVTIALITTRQLTLKDYCADPDEINLLNGIQAMVQKLSGSLALITCKDPLRSTFQQNLKSFLDVQNVPQLTQQDKEALISKAVSDNLDLGCQEIRQKVMEQALSEANQDKQIKEAVDQRRAAKEKNLLFVDEKYYQFAKLLPLALQPKLAASIDYGDIVRPNLASEYNAGFTEQLTKFLQDMDPSDSTTQAQAEAQFKKILFSDVLLNNLSEVLVQAIIQADSQQKIKVIVDILGLLIEMNTGRFKQPNVSLQVKEALFPRLSLDITIKPTLYSALNALLSKLLISTQQYQEILMLLVTRNSTNETVSCVTNALKEMIFENKQFQLNEFSEAILALKLTMGSRQELPPGYSLFIQELKKTQDESALNKTINLETALDQIATIYSAIDPQVYSDIIQRVEQWLPIVTHEEMSSYINQLEQTVILQGEEASRRFFVLFADICVKHSLDSAKKFSQLQLQQVNSLDFACVDCFTKLIEILQKTLVAGDRKQLLTQIFESIFIVLTKYHEIEEQEFNQRPFFRIFFNLLYDIQRPQYGFLKNEINEIFYLLAEIFHQLAPSKYPGFATAWLELVSHRYFMPVIMENEENWGMYCQLIIDLIRFFKEIMVEENLMYDYIKVFYRGTVRVLLVLLHDWPDFLAKFSNSFCDEIPEDFNQIRNIILAAFPKSMKPPDPFQNTEQIFENNDDFKFIPMMEYSVYNKRSKELNNEINICLRTNSDDDFKNFFSKCLFSPKTNLADSENISCLVLSLPLLLSQLQPSDPKTLLLKNDSYKLLLKILKSSSFDTREIVLSTIINQIRYPNFITKFYIQFILLTFQDNNPAFYDIQEQITRIIVERLFVQKPHPWGIIFTFIEIIKSNQNFRQKPFVKSAELKLVFKFIYQEAANKPKPPVNSQPQQMGSNAPQPPQQGQTINNTTINQ